MFVIKSVIFSYYWRYAKIYEENIVTVISKTKSSYES